MPRNYRAKNLRGVIRFSSPRLSIIFYALGKETVKTVFAGSVR